MSNSIQGRIYTSLEKDPSRNAVMFYNDGSKSKWYSGEQFYFLAKSYATALADKGLSKSDVCVIVLPSGELSLMLLTATLFLGAIPLLIAPPNLQAEGAFSSLSQIIKRIVSKTKPHLVIIPESMAGIRELLINRNAKTQILIGESDITPDNSSNPSMIFPGESEVAAMQLTSGTTGFPRVCVWRQKNVLAALDGMSVAMELSEEDICLNWTPLYHDMGLVNNFLLCITSGTPLVMMSPNEFVKKPALWLRGLVETGATLTWSPNFGFAITAQRVRDKEIEGIRLDNVRAFWNAAERIHYETLLAFQKRFTPYGLRPEALKTNFGCAENVGGATFSDPNGRYLVEHVDRQAFLAKRIAQPVDEISENHLKLSVVGVGKPHPGIRIEILSRNGRSLPDGHIGEIALDTPSRMDGYLGDARASKRAIKDNLLRTGDLGYMRSGELFWVGRVRERITIRGVKIDPSDFEPVLLNVSGLRHGSFAAFGVDDPIQGTQRIVIVGEVRDSTTRTLDEISGDIRNQVFTHLGININEVVLVKSGTLTKTSSGKRRHRYFRRLYMEGKLNQYKWIPGKGNKNDSVR